MSSSVADATDFLNLELQPLPKFKNSDSAVIFIHKSNVVFDMLNSKNTCGTDSKEPVTLNDLAAWKQQAKDLADFIFYLRDEEGQLLRKGCRKTAILGLTFSLHSMMDLCKQLLK